MAVPSRVSRCRASSRDGRAARPSSPTRRRGSRCSGGAGALLDGHAPVDAVFLGRVITRRLVVGAAVVPDHDIAAAPAVAVLTLGLDHPLCQLLDQVVALLRLQPLDAGGFYGI